jgi:hypothetical protein
VVAVLVDINVVIGLITLFWVRGKSISALHIIFALAAVGLLHASAKSAERKKVAVFWGLAFLLLIATWATNADWGPAVLKNVWPINRLGPAPVPTPGG